MNTDKWFENMIARSSGRNLDEFHMMDKLFQETQAIKQDQFDGHKYDEILRQAIELAEIVNERAIDHPTWEALVQDAYLSLWKALPRLQEQAQIRPSHLVNRATIEKLLSSGDYEELRTWTKLDDWSAAMGTISLAARLAQFFDEQEDLMEKQQSLAQQEQELMDMLDRMEQQFEQGMSDEEIDESLDDMIQSLNEYEDAVEELTDSTAANGHGLKEAVSGGMKDAVESAEESVEMVSSFGTNPGQWQKLDPRKRLELAKRLRNNRKLHKIALMVGRMKRLAIGQWSRRVIHGVDEIFDVTIGDNLEHVLPSEMLYLADEDTEDVFWSKFLEKTLLQYDLRGNERSAKGAMVVLMDNSGSMSGDREVWAKALALALLEICKRERRDFYGIHFSWGKENLAEWYFPKGEVEIEDVMAYAEHFWSGGTDFEIPISRATEILEKQFSEAGAVRGDIVMITDGEAYVSPEWLARFTNAKKLLDFKLYGVLIGYHGTVLETLADQTYTINEIMNGDDVKEMFTYV